MESHDDSSKNVKKSSDLVFVSPEERQLLADKHFFEEEQRIKKAYYEYFNNKVSETLKKLATSVGKLPVHKCLDSTWFGDGCQIRLEYPLDDLVRECRHNQIIQGFAQSGWFIQISAVYSMNYDKWFLDILMDNKPHKMSWFSKLGTKMIYQSWK